MTILFPGRSEPPTRASREFRNSVVQCIATRVDKRHIVHDFAASEDNTVFVPHQDDESRWLNEMDDWSGFLIIKLFTPDFKMDGTKTGFDIMHGEWHLYQDGRVHAVEESQGMLSKQQGLPPASAYRVKYGLTIGEAADTYESRPPPPPQYSRSQTDPRWSQGGPPPRLQNVHHQAQAQYFNHRRAFSDPYGIDLPPFDPRFGPDERASKYFAAPALPPSRHGTGSSMYAPPPGIPPPGDIPFGYPPHGARNYDQDELGYNFQQPQMPFGMPPASLPPPPNFYQPPTAPVERRRTVLRKRSRASSLNKDTSSSSLSGDTRNTVTSRDGRRKLSRRSSRRLSGPNGFEPNPNYYSAPPTPRDDGGKGCIIC